MTFYAFTSCDDIEGTKTEYATLDEAWAEAEQHELGGVQVVIGVTKYNFLTSVYRQGDIERIKADLTRIAGVTV